MNASTTQIKYLLVIDTEQYAGNFERPLCAYLTGRIGDCSVGDEYVNLLKNKPSFSNVFSVPDEHGCERPCVIFPIPGWFNNGLGGHFRDGQEDEALEAYRIAGVAYVEQSLSNYLRIRDSLFKGNKIHGWTLKACDKVIKENQEKIESYKTSTTFTKYPSYQSVGIYMVTKPTKKQIDFVVANVQGFNAAKQKLESWDKTVITFTGVRVIKEKVVTTEELINQQFITTL